MQRFVTAVFSHETNTFSSIPTPLEAFGRFSGGKGPVSGDAAVAAYRGTNSPVAAYIDLAEEAGAELNFAIAAQAKKGCTLSECSRNETSPQMQMSGYTYHADTCAVLTTTLSSHHRVRAVLMLRGTYLQGRSHACQAKIGSSRLLWHPLVRKNQALTQPAVACTHRQHPIPIPMSDYTCFRKAEKNGSG